MMTPPAASPAPLACASQSLGGGAWLVRRLYDESSEPYAFYLNTLVLLGEEPVIVETGSAADRQAWAKDVYSLVAPDDVRWLVVTSEADASAGNLAFALDMSPAARLVGPSELVMRLAQELALPAQRVFGLDEGESFTAGERVLRLVSPPVTANEGAAGFFDEQSGVYWAGGAFGALLTRPVDAVADLYAAEWREGFEDYHVEMEAFAPASEELTAAVERLRSLQPRAIAGSFTPVIEEHEVGLALDMLFDLP